MGGMGHPQRQGSGAIITWAQGEAGSIHTRTELKQRQRQGMKMRCTESGQHTTALAHEGEHQHHPLSAQHEAARGSRAAAPTRSLCTHHDGSAQHALTPNHLER